MGNKDTALSGVVGNIDITNADGLNFTGPITLIAWAKPAQKDSSPVLRDILAHGFAFSSWLANLNSVASSPNLPENITPMGKPSVDQCNGTDIEGWPVTLYSAV